MFQPGYSGAIWVPVYNMSWGWSGIANYGSASGEWSLASPAVVGGGIYNPVAGTCQNPCIVCPGATGAEITPSSFSIPSGTSENFQFLLIEDDGSTENYTSEATWDGSSSVITVTTGEATALEAGSAGISAAMGSGVPEYSASFCAGTVCPTGGQGASITGSTYDATPFINLVTPSTFTVGVATPNVTLQGGNFGTNQPTVTFTLGTVQVTGYTDSTITVIVTANTAGTGTFSLTSTGFDGQSFEGEGMGSPQATSPNVTVTPGISMNGKAVTSATTTVVVGGQIPLAATGMAGASVSSQSWSISSGPTYVGGFTLSATSDSISAPATNGGTLTYYYLSAGTSTVTYSAVLSSGQTVSAQTTFTVVAPTYSISAAPPGTVNVNNDNGGWQFQFGRNSASKGPPGVKFTPTITAPSGFSTGAFEWVQVVTGYTGTYTSPQGTLTCTSSGADGDQPYSVNTPYMTDSPRVALTSPYTTEGLNESFSTYLLWQPSVSPSIFVTIAQVTWGFSGQAVLGTSWAVSTNPAPTVTTPSVKAQSAYPIFSLPVDPDNCH
jgi:hypothetical protein